MPIPKQILQIPLLALSPYAAITMSDTIEDAVKPVTIARLVQTATSKPRFLLRLSLTSADSIAWERGQLEGVELEVRVRYLSSANGVLSAGANTSNSSADNHHP